MKKHTSEIINRINLLIKSDSISYQETQILSESKNRLAEGKNYEFEMVKLRNALLPLVISSDISSDVLAFYKDIRSERKISWGEGSTLLTGLSNLPKSKK